LHGTFVALEWCDVVCFLVIASASHDISPRTSVGACVVGWKPKIEFHHQHLRQYTRDLSDHVTQSKKGGQKRT
jgi:hypothetical protein